MRILIVNLANYHAFPPFIASVVAHSLFKAVGILCGGTFTAAFRWWKGRSGVPEHIDFRMTTRAIWERDYRPHLLDVDESRLNLEVRDVAGTDVTGMDVEGTRKALAKRAACLVLFSTNRLRRSVRG